MKPDDRIEPHDPRLSEWIDGRLPPAEAADVARLVAASPELTHIVADLRAMKEALGSMPAATAPAGFVRDVLAAVEAAGHGSPDRDDLDDAEVEAEWRKLERQRIDEEIAEAHEDAADIGAETMRHRWPWLALAASLAAGVLVAFLINRPGPGDRQLAMTEAARPAAPAPIAADQTPAAPADAWTPEEAEPAAPPPAEESRVVTVRIRDAEGRQRLGTLLAASGLETKAAAGDGERELLANHRGLAEPSAESETAQALGAADAAKPAAPPPLAKQDEALAARAPERIEVSGPAEAIAALAAALEALAAEPRADADAAESLARSRGAVPGPAPEAGGSGQGAGAQDRAAVEPAATRLVILVVDEFGADPADQQEEP